MVSKTRKSLCSLIFDLVCCEYGNGGPLELFSGPYTDGELIFSLPFEGEARLSPSFVVVGEASTSNSSGYLLVSALTCVLLSLLV